MCNSIPLTKTQSDCLEELSNFISKTLRPASLSSNLSKLGPSRDRPKQTLSKQTLSFRTDVASRQFPLSAALKNIPKESSSKFGIHQPIIQTTLKFGTQFSIKDNNTSISTISVCSTTCLIQFLYAQHFIRFLAISSGLFLLQMHISCFSPCNTQNTRTWRIENARDIQKHELLREPVVVWYTGHERDVVDQIYINDDTARARYYKILRFNVVYRAQKFPQKIFFQEGGAPPHIMCAICYSFGLNNSLSTDGKICSSRLTSQIF